MRPLVFLRKTPTIDFMRWHKAGFAFSILLGVVSIGMFLALGLNYGTDFRGGVAMVVRSTTGPAALAQMRATLDGLHLGDTSLQGFGSPSDVLIRVPEQAGGDATQQAVHGRFHDIGDFGRLDFEKLISFGKLLALLLEPSDDLALGHRQAPFRHRDRGDFGGHR